MTPSRLVSEYEEGLITAGELMAGLVRTLESAEPKSVLLAVEKHDGLKEIFVDYLRGITSDTSWISLGSGIERRISPAAYQGVERLRELIQCQRAEQRRAASP